MKINAKVLIAFLLIIMMQAACASNAQPAASPPVEVPTDVPLAATPTALPLYQRVTLGSTPLMESDKAPDYELQAQVPVLTGSDDLRVVTFNQAAERIVQNQIDSFKQMLGDMSIVPIVAGSGFYLQHTLLSPPGNILSLKFEISQYADGAAHPFGYSITLNYDLEQGQEVGLEQLFLPGTDYLQVIADYCQTELKKRDIGFDIFTEGANPTPENYRNWNITANGLLITFDEYQVAAYAAGPQTVVIPYAALKDIIDPQGPIGNKIK